MSHRETTKEPVVEYRIETKKAVGYTLSNGTTFREIVARHLFAKAKSEAEPGDVVRLWEHKTTHAVIEEWKA